MSHAAGNLRLRQPAISSPHLTPSYVANATCLSGSVRSNFATLSRACDEVFNRWRRFLPEHEARAEADAFRRRFESIAVQEVVTERELDAVLELVADTMASS